MHIVLYNCSFKSIKRNKEKKYALKLSFIIAWLPFVLFFHIKLLPEFTFFQPEEISCKSDLLWTNSLSYCCSCGVIFILLSPLKDSFTMSVIFGWQLLLWIYHLIGFWISLSLMKSPQFIFMYPCTWCVILFFQIFFSVFDFQHFYYDVCGYRSLWI